MTTDKQMTRHMWVEDAKTTAWRLLIETGQWPGCHMEKREPLDAPE